jgi:hypothetical protein
VTWSVPKHATYADGFNRLSDSANGREWHTMDIDGDARPDLVWYADATSKVWNAATSPYWKVFRNSP